MQTSLTSRTDRITVTISAASGWLGVLDHGGLLRIAELRRFNLGCGTAHQLNSYVEAWIYDSQGIRSNPVEVALTCTT